ncbi:MAG: Fur family transcriptional regulator [Patescibacteria group bacterium]
MKKITVTSRNILKSKGLRVTASRVAILDTLLHAPGPLSIRGVLAGLTATTDQATVYRTLESLENCGAVRQVNLRHGHAHYEVASDDHHHVVCRNCGAVENFQECGIAAVRRKVLKQTKSFARIDEHALEFFGLCMRCSKKHA